RPGPQVALVRRAIPPVEHRADRYRLRAPVHQRHVDQPERWHNDAADPRHDLGHLRRLDQHLRPAVQPDVLVVQPRLARRTIASAFAPAGTAPTPPPPSPFRPPPG